MTIAGNISKFQNLGGVSVTQTLNSSKL